MVSLAGSHHRQQVVTPILSALLVELVVGVLGLSGLIDVAFFVVFVFVVAGVLVGAEVVRDTFLEVFLF